MEDFEGSKKKTMRFLTVSLIILIIICVGSLSTFAWVVSKKNESTLNNVGELYMHGMSERISDHFGTTISLRMDQVEAMVRSFPPDEVVSAENTYSGLVEQAKICEFGSLALCDDNGKFEVLYGDALEMIEPISFFNSLNNGEEKIGVARTQAGEKVMILCVPAKYPMPQGGTSSALVASVSADYIRQILALDATDLLTYSHIIRHDGTYVIRSVDREKDNYFERALENLSEYDGKTPQIYLAELRASMEAHEDYSTIMIMDNERRHLYCTPLPYTDWYLITVMPYGMLDETLSSLSEQVLICLFVSLGVILLVISIIFAMYLRMTQKQIRVLEDTRLEAVRANKAKSEFLSNMSHDIRTPMNAIVGMTAIAMANIDNKPQVQNSLKKIAVSGKHLLGLINDVLDMSKIESGKMTLSLEPISLRETVDNIVSIIQPQIKSKSQKFDVFIYDIENENVYCDSVRLNQVLLNLLSNAIKYTPEGGSISMSLREEKSPKGDNFVRMNICIKDSGIGMIPEFKEQIFDSFTREDRKRVRKTEGSGLGMAITKYIVDAMDGEISVESEKGVGSEFRVVIDLECVDISEEEMVLPNWNMLVVDDDEQLRDSAAAALSSIGISAECAPDGESAIEMLKEKHGKPNDYQIILLDWKLPGMDGIETARAIHKQLGDDIPILLISAYDWSDIEDEAREAGISGFIQKPLFKSTLYLGLKKYAGEEFADNSSPSEKVSLDGLRVLIAEDNELNWEIASELLNSQLGVETELAENGQICVEKFKNSPVGYYDAILMDIRMPVMTGYEATEAIRASGREDSDVLIVAMTADVFSEDVAKCLKCGMNAHVAKPIDIDMIGRILQNHLGK